MNIGILLNNFGQNELAYYTLAQCSQLVKEDKSNSYFGFYEQLQPYCLDPPMSLMNVCEIVDFKGKLITTDLDMTERALGVVSDIEIIFYVHDLDWLRERKNRKNFFQNIKTYNNPDVTIISPSEHYAKELKNYSNRISDHVVKAFSLREILDVVR